MRTVASRTMRARLLAPAAAAALLIAPGAPAHAQDGSALAGQLARAFRGASSASGAYVQDLDSGRPLFSRRAGTMRMPASVEKLWTTSTAMLRLGPDSRLQTAALTTGELLPDGTLEGDLVLRGGGDPSLGPWGLGQ